MNEVEVAEVEHDHRSRGWVAAPPPGARIIPVDTVLRLADGSPVGFLAEFPDPALASRIAGHSRRLAARRWGNMLPPATKTGRPQNEARLSGLVVGHAVFGYVPPTPLRRRWGGSIARLNQQFPEFSADLARFTLYAAATLHDVLPEQYADTVGRVDKLIAPAWRIAGTPWTSGIINNTASLPYHRDAGNVKGAWSAMLGMRRYVGGGLLHLADYDVYLSIDDNSLAIFDGGRLLHGVTPLHREGTRGEFRYTAVLYARRGLHVCHPDPSREPERAQLAATLHQVNARLSDQCSPATS